MNMLPKKYKAKESEPRWQKVLVRAQCICIRSRIKKRSLFGRYATSNSVWRITHWTCLLLHTSRNQWPGYQRMKGKNVFYPFGFDDNGLPTERFVEKKNKVRGKDLKRSEFNDLCRNTVAELEEQFRKMWSALGFLLIGVFVTAQFKKIVSEFPRGVFRSTQKRTC